jgi:hypothetical protein
MTSRNLLAADLLSWTESLQRLAEAARQEGKEAVSLPLADTEELIRVLREAEAHA